MPRFAALLDRLGIDRAHIAGNSLGGWTALELAKLRRARSVCALGPAGLWERRPITPMLRLALPYLRACRRDLLPPQTRWVEPLLVGHVPMWDDPVTVAGLILDAAAEVAQR